MSAVEIFDYSGYEVRTSAIDGEPWFVAKDVCDVLGLANVAMAMRAVEDSDRGLTSVDAPNGAAVTVNTINESGLYELIFQSRRPEAKKFRRWVTQEVLPQIRRTGSYSAPAQVPSHAESLRGWAAEIEAREIAERELAIAAPKAESWDVLAEAAGDYSVRDAAQILDRDPAIATGQNRLFTTLAEIGWLDRRGTPYQKHIDAGRISSRPRSYDHPHTGEPVLAKPQVRISVKGVHELHKHLGGSTPLMFPVDGAA